VFSSHVKLFTSQQPIRLPLKEAGAFSLVEVKVISVQFSLGTQISCDNELTEQIRGDLVWIKTESRRYYLFVSFFVVLILWLLFQNFTLFGSRSEQTGES
jgi:hypothetical protein